MTTTMTKTAPAAPNAPAASAPPKAYSKDYWDLVFEQLGRNDLFKLALGILALLYASAIYAPLIANDQPFVIEAVNRSEYGDAHRTLYPAVLGAASLAKKTPEEYLEKRTEGSTQTFEQALNAEREAVNSRLEVMSAWLPEGDHASLDDLLAKVDEAFAASRAGDTERAGELGGEAKDIAKTIRADYKPFDPEKEAEGGKRLRPLTRYPLFDTLTWGEVLMMVMWAMVLTWPLWNRFVNKRVLSGNRSRIRRARKPKFFAVLGLSALAALLWWAVSDDAGTNKAASFKAEITAGQIEVVRTVMPLIPYGFAETNGAENFRPPTAVEKAEISEEGYYVRGARVPKADPVTGYMPPAKPVAVLYGEPDRNSPYRHVLGTDKVGRDFLTRILWGGRVSLTVGLLSAALLLVIGTVIGAIAGYFGGWVDLVISRIIEVFLCIPAFPLILMVAAFIDPNVISPIYSIVIIIALIRWTGVARLVRAEFLRLREAEFAVAAKALGFSSARTIFRHILPNAFAPALVAGAFAVASGILTESTMSFLGFGIQPPIASWGSLINESKAPEHWWVQVFPGLLIFITITCYNQVGDAFRDAVDPKTRKN
ncbi:MAG: ABC transporter permease [Planctomycetes bacterium]|nr:ABC transporter permease [Planctomycetota bacterium]MCB9905576.1 ABC transporter permease [Planctomycetota bacterium]